MKKKLANAIPLIKNHLMRINPQKWFKGLKDPRDKNKINCKIPIFIPIHTFYLPIIHGAIITPFSFT